MDKEKFDIEAFPTSESALRMLGNVTQGFYDKSYVGKWLYQVMGLEYDEARNLVEELPLQMFPETATWGLMYHEIKWQLPVLENLPYEERRQLIYQKRDYRAPMTPYCMERYLEPVLRYKVNVTDCNEAGIKWLEHPNLFYVVFEGEGTLNVKLAKKLLNNIKQSHTLYCLIERVYSEYFVEIKCTTVLTITGEFFPRDNLFLYLDGTWKIDGTQQLGEKIDDFYPVSMNVIAIVQQDIQNESQLAIQQSVKTNTNIDNIIHINAETKVDCELEQMLQMCISTEEKVNTETKLAIEKDLWYLDGTYALDGEKLLNADIYYYPL